MAVFPVLSTGAVCQYPARVIHQQAVQVLRYIDGSEQRFLQQGRQLRRWEIRLDLLSETEVSTLEKFFQTQLGDYSCFDFFDPFTNTLISQCVLGTPYLTSELLGIGTGSASCWVIETNG